MREKGATGAAGEHSRAVAGATGGHPGTATGADPEGGEIRERGSPRALDPLRRRIRAQGYPLSDVAQALGWLPDHLAQARDRDLTYPDILLIGELIGESGAELLAEVGWLAQEETADLKPVVVPAKDYLLDLLAAPSPTPPHPIREGWTALDRRKLRAEALARYHYLAWLLAWLECSEELDRRALQRRRAKTFLKQNERKANRATARRKARQRGELNKRRRK